MGVVLVNFKSGRKVIVNTLGYIGFVKIAFFRLKRISLSRSSVMEYSRARGTSCRVNIKILLIMTLELNYVFEEDPFMIRTNST